VTILINNSGIIVPETILDSTENDIRKQFNVNTLASYWTVKAFLPAMIHLDHGHIVGITSTMGLFSVSLGASYCASKAAAIRFYEGLHQEVLYKYGSTKNVHISWIIPSLIKTEMFEGITKNEFLSPALDTSEVAQRIIEVIENGQGQEVAMPLVANVAGVSQLLSLSLRDLLVKSTGASRALFKMQEYRRKQAEVKHKE